MHKKSLTSYSLFANKSQGCGVWFALVCILLGGCTDLVSSQQKGPPPYEFGGIASLIPVDNGIFRLTWEPPPVVDGALFRVCPKVS